MHNIPLTASAEGVLLSLSRLWCHSSTSRNMALGLPMQSIVISYSTSPSRPPWPKPSAMLSPAHDIKPASTVPALATPSRRASGLPSHWGPVSQSPVVNSSHPFKLLCFILAAQARPQYCSLQPGVNNLPGLARLSNIAQGLARLANFACSSKASTTCRAQCLARLANIATIGFSCSISFSSSCRGWQVNSNNSCPSQLSAASCLGLSKAVGKYCVSV